MTVDRLHAKEGEAADYAAYSRDLALAASEQARRRYEQQQQSEVGLQINCSVRHSFGEL